MLNKLLGGYAAVRIENHEEFEKVKEILAIKNCFLANKEPVAKMSYPGDVVFGLFRADDGFIYWSQIKDIDTNKYELISVDDLNIETSNNVIEATVVSETEVIDVNEKNMRLTVLNKPETAGIQSNVNDLVKLIPIIEAKANVIVDENNYKTFIEKGTGLVPTLRKYAKGLRDEKKKIKDAYMKSFDEFNKKVDLVVNALETTAKTIANNVDIYEQQRKDEARKEKMLQIEELKKVLIDKKMISKEYADKFEFDERWLNVSCSNKKFMEEVDKQFQDLINQQNIEKQNLEMIENTITNTCQITGVDEKLINKTKYLLLLQQGTNLGDITKMITDEVNALKQQKERMLEAQKREDALKEERFKKQQEEAEKRHQEELKQVQNTAPADVTVNVFADERTGEVYAKATDKNITVAIQEAPAKVPEDKIFAYTYKFEGNCKAILTFNKCLKALSKLFKSFKYMEVK